MDNPDTVELESARLLLRRFTMEDAPAMLANWANDPEVTKFLNWPAHKSLGDSENILSEWVSRYEGEEGFYQWAIVRKENGGEPIGSIGVVQKNEAAKMVDIGYCIGKKWWNQGITSEALKMVTQYLFSTGQFNRIQARHDPRNPHSGQVMQKCGMRYEGTLRQADRSNQGISDIAVYAILAEDYYAMQDKYYE
ncbi:MAG: GNAT family N-acetyltransferase [Clostridiales bacterium]|nr:GNAT family N-acetyltransferase [Clostridiales bacterium]